MHACIYVMMLGIMGDGIQPFPCTLHTRMILKPSQLSAGIASCMIVMPHLTLKVYLHANTPVLH